MPSLKADELDLNFQDRVMFLLQREKAEREAIQEEIRILRALQKPHADARGCSRVHVRVQSVSMIIPHVPSSPAHLDP